MAVLQYVFPDDATVLSVPVIGTINMTAYAGPTGTTLANVTDLSGTSLTSSILGLTSSGVPGFTSDQNVVYLATTAITERYKLTAVNVNTLTLLNGVSMTGAGSAITPKQGFYYTQAVWTGSPTSASVTIEISLDGGAKYWPVATLTESTNNYLSFMVPTTTSRVRANLTSITGGTSPTCSVSLFQ